MPLPLINHVGPRLGARHVVEAVAATVRVLISILRAHVGVIVRHVRRIPLDVATFAVVEQRVGNRAPTFRITVRVRPLPGDFTSELLGTKDGIE